MIDVDALLIRGASTIQQSRAVCDTFTPEEVWAALSTAHGIVGESQRIRGTAAEICANSRNVRRFVALQRELRQRTTERRERGA